MDQGGNFWALFTPGIWKGLHAVLQEVALPVQHIRSSGVPLVVPVIVDPRSEDGSDG